MTGKALWEKMVGVLFPERCAVCGDVVYPGECYCEVCRRELKRVEEPRCLRCGCGKAVCVCHGHRQAYDALLSVFYYEGRFKKHFPSFKRTPRYRAAAVLAQEMAVLLREKGWSFDAITYVPTHRTVQRERGFEPARLLAESLSREMGRPLLSLLKKIWDTPSQKSLPAWRRRGNLLGVFEVTEALTPAVRRVLLVDDICTTGSTLDESAKMLKIYGVERVYAITVATTLLKHEN